MNAPAASTHKLDLLEPISEKTADRILSNESLRADCIKRGVDLGMIVSNLRLTVEQRILNLQKIVELQSALRNAPWDSADCARDYLRLRRPAVRKGSAFPGSG